MLGDWANDGFWHASYPDLGCTKEEMAEAAEGYLKVSDLALNPSGQAGIAGITPAEFMELYNERTNYTHPLGSDLVTMSYDAVWAVALALNATEIQLIATGLCGASRYHCSRA